MATDKKKAAEDEMNDLDEKLKAMTENDRKAWREEATKFLIECYSKLNKAAAELGLDEWERLDALVSYLERQRGDKLPQEEREWLEGQQKFARKLREMH
jgi:hypothetical protein